MAEFIEILGDSPKEKNMKSVLKTMIHFMVCIAGVLLFMASILFLNSLAKSHELHHSLHGLSLLVTTVLFIIVGSNISMKIHKKFS